jgi:hypothetical protein
MGCWNGTDLITQLPIYSGDEVVLFLIKKQVDKLPVDEMCYQHELFKPLPMLLYGEYDDYGAIENVTGDLDLFYQIIEKELEIDEDDVKSLCDKCYGGYDNQEKANAYLRYLQDGKSDYKIEFVLMHKELFDKLKSYDDYWDGKEKFVEEYYGQLTIAKLEQQLKEQGLSEDQIYIKLFKMRLGTSTYNCPMDIREFDDYNPDSINKETISSILSISGAMTPLRKFWFPQSGAGSQCDINELHTIVGDFYNKYLEDYKKRWEE